MRDRGEHVEEQPHALRKLERAIFAVAIDRHAGDVFEHKVRPPAAAAHAGIEQPRDVRVREPRQDAAFAREPLDAAARHQPGVEELDRDVAFEAAVGAPCEPDAAHAALAELALYRVGADGLADQARLRQVIGFAQQRRPLEEGLGVHLGEPVDQRGHLVGERCVLVAQGGDAARARRSVAVEDLVQQRAQA